MKYVIETRYADGMLHHKDIVGPDATFDQALAAAEAAARGINAPGVWTRTIEIRDDDSTKRVHEGELISVGDGRFAFRDKLGKPLHDAPADATPNAIPASPPDSTPT